MARIVFGPLVTGIRGTIAGITFSATHSGAYAKGYVCPVRKNTPASTQRRQTFSQPGAVWNGLTSGERDDWNSWAADAAQEKTDSLGQAYYITGWNWFVALYQQAISTGQTIQTTAPTLSRPIAPTLSAITWTESPSSEIVAEFTAGDAEDLYLIFRVSLSSKSMAALPGDTAWRIIASGPGDDTDDELSFTGLEDIFGTVTAGQQYTIYASFQNLESDRSAETVYTGTVT